MRTGESVSADLVELPGFLVDAENRLSDEDRDQLRQHLTVCPQSGFTIEGFDYLWVVRWNVTPRKRAYVLYFYYGPDCPIYLLAACDSKPEAINVAKDDPETTKRLIRELSTLAVSSKVVLLRSPHGAA